VRAANVVAVVCAPGLLSGMTVSTDAVQRQSNPIPWRDRRKLPAPPVDEQLWGANFEAMLMELRRARWSKAAIANTLGLARSNVNAYASGKHQPLHPAGELIIALWCQQTGKPRDDVPLRPIYRRHHVRAEGRRDLGRRSKSHDATSKELHPAISSSGHGAPGL